MNLLLGTANHETLNDSTAATGYEIQGLGGHDVIYGSAYADLIVGGSGFDQMFGNDGDDTFLIAGSDTNAEFVYGGSGIDTLPGSSGNDVLLIPEISSIERIDGGGGLDVLRGIGPPVFKNL